MRTLLTLTLLAFVSACSHPLEIVGEGDILSESGGRTCMLYEFQAGLDTCSKNYVVRGYQETYYAVPHQDWKFEHWVNYCAEAIDNECSFSADAAIVWKFWGATVPPLRAVFTIDHGTPITDTVWVDGREWAQVNNFTGVTWNEVDAVCAGEFCSGKLNGYNVTGWVWASVDDLNGLFNSYLEEEGALGPGPDRLSTFDPTNWASDFYEDGWSPTVMTLYHHRTFGLLSTGISTDYAYEARVDDTFDNDPFNGSSDEAATIYAQKKHVSESYMGVWMYRVQEITETVTVGDRVWAQPDLFVGLSWNQIKAQCPSEVCASGATLNSLDMEGWQLASVDEVSELFNQYIGPGGIGPGPDFIYAPHDSWGARFFNDGFRRTLQNSEPEGTYSQAIEGLTADLVIDAEDSVHVGVFEDALLEGFSDHATTYGSHGKDEGYGFTGAWFYKK